mgnify:CR=1 FL=1
MAEGVDDPRGTMGGAVNALGRLLMKNTALRGHRAINGGALYTEGKVSIERSVMTFNTADRCGGMIYSAGKTTIDSCKLESNRCGHFDCKKKSAAQIMGPLGEFDDDMLGGGGDDSALGAVAEGPPLTIDGRAAHARAVAEGAATARMPPRPPSPPKRRRRKRSSNAAVAELDDLAEEIEYDEELASRMEREEDEQEEQERAAEERQRAAEAAAAAPPEEEPTCDPERHGGKGGNLHELACEAGLWPTGRKVRPLTAPYTVHRGQGTPSCTLVHPLTPPYARCPPSASCGAPLPTAPVRGSASRARCAPRTRARTHTRSLARARASHYLAAAGHATAVTTPPPPPRRRRRRPVAGPRLLRLRAARLERGVRVCGGAHDRRDRLRARGLHLPEGVPAAAAAPSPAEGGGATRRGADADQGPGRWLREALCRRCLRSQRVGSRRLRPHLL